MTYIKATWAGGPILDPKNPDDLRTSNFTDMFLWGSVNYNKSGTYTINATGMDIVSYDPSSKAVAWVDNAQTKTYVERINAIMASGSTIKTLHLMLGGPPTDQTFVNLRKLIFPDGNLNNPRIKPGDPVFEMISALKAHVPQISGIQYDEEHYDASEYDFDTNAAFTSMLLADPFDYGISYIPAWSPNDFWGKSLQKFGDQIKGIYLQIYSGSDPQNWINFLEGAPYNIPAELVRSIIRPVLKVEGACPTELAEKFTNYNSLNLTGGGLFMYDNMAGNSCTPPATTPQYAAAVEAGDPSH